MTGRRPGADGNRNTYRRPRELPSSYPAGYEPWQTTPARYDQGDDRHSSRDMEASGTFSPYGRGADWQDAYPVSPWQQEENYPPYETGAPEDNAEFSPMEDTQAYEAWDNGADESTWDDAPPIIATNGTVKLTCTLAAMLSPFALFLCFEEKRSNAVRHFARQSAGLGCVHVALGLVLFIIGSLLGGVPFLGLLTNAVCWLCYIMVAMVTLFFRVRMMKYAWRGWRYTLPVIGRRLEKLR